MSKYDEKIIPTLDDVIKPGDLDKAVIGDLNSFDDASDDDDGTIELFTDSTTELDDTFDTEFDKLYTDTDSATEDLALDDALLDTTDDELALQADSLGDDSETINLSDDKTTDDAFDISIEAPVNDTDISALEETPEQFQVASQIDDASLENAADYDDLSDNHDDLADLIVAESFPQNDAALHASIEDDAHDIDITANDKPRAYDVASWGEPVVNFDKPEEPVAQPQAEVTPAAAVTVTATETATETTSEAPAETRGESPGHATAASAAIAADINVGALVDDITKKLMPEIEWKVRMRLREVLDEIFPEKD